MQKQLTNSKTNSWNFDIVFTDLLNSIPCAYKNLHIEFVCTDCWLDCGVKWWIHHFDFYILTHKCRKHLSSLHVKCHWNIANYSKVTELFLEKYRLHISVLCSVILSCIISIFYIDHSLQCSLYPPSLLYFPSQGCQWILGVFYLTSCHKSSNYFLWKVSID